MTRNKNHNHNHNSIKVIVNTERPKRRRRRQNRRPPASSYHAVQTIIHGGSITPNIMPNPYPTTNKPVYNIEPSHGTASFQSHVPVNQPTGQSTQVPTNRPEFTKPAERKRLPDEDISGIQERMKAHNENMRAMREHIFSRQEPTAGRTGETSSHEPMHQPFVQATQPQAEPSRRSTATIINPETGRNITRGGSTHKKLIRKGLMSKEI